ncbi:MAG: SPOR domain-containing protein [Proteobacteria bacterium]|nr:SPOR domain-containing protein [Pseudomonadota bacterium]
MPETVDAVAAETSAPEEEPAQTSPNETPQEESPAEETPPPLTPPPSTAASAAPDAAPLQGDMEMEKPGSWSVQLGYYRSLIYARNYWEDIAPRVEELQPGIESRIVTVDRGPERGIFRRLLAGSFTARSQAVSLCNNLKTIGIDCVVINP